MAQNYTRQSSMADGDTITAALFNNEYNQLVNAFAYSSSSASSTGHRHDGSTGQGGNVPQIGDLDFLNKVVVDGTNNRVGFFVEVSSSAVEQIRVQDGAIVPVTDNDIDLGTSSLEFKDLFLDGTAHVDTLDVDVNATVAGTLGVTGAFTGSSTVQGTTITATTAFVPDASDGAALGTSSLEFSDLFLADGAVVSFGDDQDVTLTHVADTGLLLSSTDQLQFGDSGTYIHQSADGVLDLVSDTEIEINATTIDVNGAMELSGAFTGASTIQGTTITATTAFVPDASDGAALGTSSLEFSDLFLADGAVISLGDDQDVTVTHVADTGLLLNGTKQLQFGDSGTYIHQSADGVLDLVSDTEIEINATTIDVNGNLDLSGTLTGASTIQGTTITATTAFVPDASDGASLGTTSLEFSDLFLADEAVINLGDDQDTTLTHVADTGILLNSTRQLQFGDSGTYIHQSADGVLDLVSDTEIEINATSIDINGAVDISGNLDVGGNLVVTGTTTFNGGTLTLGDAASDNVVFGADVNSSIIPNTDNTYDLGSSSQEWKDLYVDGIAYLDGINFNGTAISATAAELNTLDGITAVVGELNALDLGSTAVGTAIASKAVILDSNKDYTGIRNFTVTGELDAATGDFSSDVDIDGDLLVGDDLTLDSDAAVLGFGADTDVTLTHVADTGLLLNSTMALQFNDASQFINAPSATVLDINATDEIELNATLVDVNANLDVSGTVTATGTSVFASLDISGDIDVDGTSNLDAIDVDGAANFAADVTFADGADIITASAGTSNTRIGVNAGNSIQSGGNYNVVVGDEAGTAITTGDSNVLIGYQTGDAITTGLQNVAVGQAALSAEDTANYSTAVGHAALFTQNAGDVDAYNTAVGYKAGLSVTTGTQNTLIGGLNGDALTEGAVNVAVGYGALTSDTLGSKSVALGHTTLANQNFTTATDSFNTAVGHSAGSAVTTGQQNTLLGGLAGDALTDADQNIAVGYRALSNDTLGSKSVSIGNYSLGTQNFTTATDSFNVAVGHGAGESVTTGQYNTLIGGQAGDALTDADGNVAVGLNALTTDTLGSKSTAVGQSALANQNFTTAVDTYNTGVGYFAGVNITTGVENTLIGSLAGDALTDADYNVALGVAALGSDTKGSKSVAIGNSALLRQNFTTATDSFNVAVGYDSGSNITTGIKNTFLGGLAGDATTDADENIAIGYDALGTNQVGSASVAVGASALRTQNPATATNMFNTAIGHFAGYAVTTGIDNTFLGVAVTTGTQNTLIGSEAGDAMTDVDFNVAVGHQALSGEVLGSRSTAIGRAALRTQSFSTATDAYNVAVGFNAGLAVTTGQYNTLIGGLAGDAITDADFNVAVGYAALTNNTLGSGNVAIGRSTLATMNPATATTMYNVAVGEQAGNDITTGVFNTLIGALAGDALTDADHNVAIGEDALGSDTLGSTSVAIGRTALFSQNFTTATNTYNTAVGYGAGSANTTGILNTFIGGLAGDANTTGTNNTYIGYGAATADDQSQQNVVVGAQAATLMNHGSEVGFQTIMGFQAGYYNVTGTSNTLVGYQSGFGVSGNSNGLNCALGRQTLYSITTGNNNAALGFAAGFNISSGSNNIAIGGDALRSGSPGGEITTASNTVGIGDENISSFNCQVALSVASDERDKTDFTDLSLGLDFVKALEPVTYYWDKRSKYLSRSNEDGTPNTDYDLDSVTPDGTHKEDWMDVGFKAQSVSALEEAAGYKIADKKNLTVSLSEDGKQYALRYEKFIPMLVKAIQEQDEIIQSLTARITALES